MKKLTRANIMTLEQYAQVRPDFRQQIMAHKSTRKVHLGEHAVLFFEDFRTMQYQLQEILRIERIFEAEAIEEELSAYNALIPDGTNWKATLMLEYSDPEERNEQLTLLLGVEDRAYVAIEGFDPVYAIADEDLKRETDSKTSSVHFLRFEFSPSMIKAARQNAAICVGIKHEHMEQEVILDQQKQAELVKDLTTFSAQP